MKKKYVRIFFIIAGLTLFVVPTIITVRHIIYVHSDTLKKDIIDTLESLLDLRVAVQRVKNPLPRTFIIEGLSIYTPRGDGLLLANSSAAAAKTTSGYVITLKGGALTLNDNTLRQLNEKRRLRVNWPRITATEITLDHLEYIVGKRNIQPPFGTLDGRLFIDNDSEITFDITTAAGNSAQTTITGTAAVTKNTLAITGSISSPSLALKDFTPITYESVTLEKCTLAFDIHEQEDALTRSFEGSGVLALSLDGKDAFAGGEAVQAELQNLSCTANTITSLGLTVASDGASAMSPELFRAICFVLNEYDPALPEDTDVLPFDAFSLTIAYDGKTVTITSDIAADGLWIQSPVLTSKRIPFPLAGVELSSSEFERRLRQATSPEFLSNPPGENASEGVLDSVELFLARLFGAHREAPAPSDDAHPEDSTTSQ